MYLCMYVYINDWIGPILISAIYSPPKLSIKKDDYVEFFKTLGNRFLAVCDYNANHTIRESRLISTQGRQLKLATDSLNLIFFWPTYLLANRYQQNSWSHGFFHSKTFGIYECVLWFLLRPFIGSFSDYFTSWKRYNNIYTIYIYTTLKLTFCPINSKFAKVVPEQKITKPTRET